MKKEIKKIVQYVKSQLRRICKEDSLELFEIILLPEVPFYIIARINAPHIKSLSDKRLDEIEAKLLSFQKAGIRCIIRPKNFKINNEILNKRILKKSSRARKYKISKLTHYPIFGKEIKALNREFRNYFSLREDDFFWEIEINLKKIFPVTVKFFSKRKKVTFKKNILARLEVLPYSNLKISKVLLNLTYIAALKKKSLLKYLLLNKSFYGN